MKPYLALPALLFHATACYACPPVDPSPEATARSERKYRDAIISSVGIAYGVVQRPITSDSRKRPGIFRVIHSYKGALAVGMNVPVRQNLSGYCILNLGRPVVTEKDWYGVGLISKFEPNNELYFRPIDKSEFDRLVQEGLIESAKVVRDRQASTRQP